MSPITHMPDQNESHLEPRVARLETGLETLTRNVSEMAVSIRENATNTNQKIDGLIVAVTTAQAPKKTDWGLFISAIGLILALGAAVLIPLNNATKDNKESISKYHESMVEHMKLDMHPVGLANVQGLMRDVAQIKAELVARDAALDIKIQREAQLMQDVVTAKIAGLDEKVQMEMKLRNEILAAKLAAHEEMDGVRRELAVAELKVVKEKNDLYIEKLFGRVLSLEGERIKAADNEHAELMQWRQKAMGLSAPDAYVPLVQRGGAVESKK